MATWTKTYTGLPLSSDYAFAIATSDYVSGASLYNDVTSVPLGSTIKSVDVSGVVTSAYTGSRSVHATVCKARLHLRGLPVEDWVSGYQDYGADTAAGGTVSRNSSTERRWIGSTTYPGGGTSCSQQTSSNNPSWVEVNDQSTSWYVGFQFYLGDFLPHEACGGDTVSCEITVTVTYDLPDGGGDPDPEPEPEDPEYDSVVCSFNGGMATANYSVTGIAGAGTSGLFVSSGVDTGALSVTKVPVGSLVTIADLQSVLDEHSAFYVNDVSTETQYFITISSSNYPYDNFVMDPEGVISIRLAVFSGYPNKTVQVPFRFSYVNHPSACTNFPAPVPCAYAEPWGSMLDDLIDPFLRADGSDSIRVGFFDTGEGEIPDYLMRKHVLIITPQTLVQHIETNRANPSNILSSILSYYGLAESQTFVLLGGLNQTLSYNRTVYSPFMMDREFGNIMTAFLVLKKPDNPYIGGGEEAGRMRGKLNGTIFDTPLYTMVETYDDNYVVLGTPIPMGPADLPNNFSLTQPDDYFILSETTSTLNVGINHSNDTDWFWSCKRVDVLLNDYIIPHLEDENWYPEGRSDLHGLTHVESYIMEGPYRLGASNVATEYVMVDGGPVHAMLGNPEDGTLIPQSAGDVTVVARVRLLPPLEEGQKYMIKSGYVKTTPTCRNEMPLVALMSKVVPPMQRIDTYAPKNISGANAHTWTVGADPATTVLRMQRNYISEFPMNTEECQKAILFGEDIFEEYVFAVGLSGAVTDQWAASGFDSFVRIDVVDTTPTPPDVGVCVYETGTPMVTLPYAMNVAWDGTNTTNNGLYCGTRKNFPGHQVPYPATFKVSQIFGMEDEIRLIMKKNGSFFSLVNDGSGAGYPLWAGDDEVTLEFGDYLYAEPVVSMESPSFDYEVIVPWKFDSEVWDTICSNDPPDPPDPPDPVDPVDPYDPSNPVKPVDPMDPNNPVVPMVPPRPGEPDATPVDPWDTYVQEPRRGVHSSGYLNPADKFDWNK